VYFLRAGSVGKEHELLFFDPVLHIATGTIHLLIQLLSRVISRLKGGNNKTGIGAFAKMLSLANYPTLPTPGCEGFLYGLLAIASAGVNSNLLCVLLPANGLPLSNSAFRSMPVGSLFPTAIASI
jgi:hypothetical protein